MIKRKFSEGDFFLVIANLLPVYGVWFLGWEARQVFLVYCLETVIIGLFTLIKLGILTTVRKSDWWENSGSRSLMHGSFFMLFFIVHYGMFVGIQTTMFLGIAFKGSDKPNILKIIMDPARYLGPDAWLLFCVFIFSYGYENLTRFVFNNEYRTKSFMRVMFEPYMRIFIQQFTVILGSLFLSFGAGTAFILIFAIVKIFFTVVVDYDKSMDQAMEKAKNREDLKT